MGLLPQFQVKPTHTYWYNNNNNNNWHITIYPKIPKISPGTYIFQRPFLRGLFLEGLIFGGAYLWREICISKSIGLALQLEGNLPFLFFFTLYLRAISKYKPPGGLYLEGRFKGGFFALQVWGAYIWRGLYTEGLIFGILLQLIKGSTPSSPGDKVL